MNCFAQIHYPVIPHSHNDYEQKEPIATALGYGFRSIEVDIAYDGNELVVAHDIDDLEGKPNFEKSYLIPFIEKVENNPETTILLVDIKNYSDSLIHKLNKLIKRHGNNFISREENNIKNNIQVILSGDIPRKEIIDNKDYPFFFIDGRIEEIDLPAYDKYTPLISINFAHITKWKGNKRPSPKVITEIKSVINQVHAKNKKIRFWNTNETLLLWSTLMALEIDFIGVDRLDDFYQKLKKVNLVKGVPK